MESHKIYINNFVRRASGFTLIEVLVVLSIITVLVSVSLFFDVSSYRGDAFRAERNVLVVAMQTARADALNNINQEMHGVAINPAGYDGYVIFEGNDYASSNPLLRTEIPAIYPVMLDASSPGEVVFTQLSGNANYTGEIKLIDTQRNASTSIVINYEGKIGY